MTLRIGDVAPDFEAETAGKIRFHEWLGDSGGPLLPPEGLHAGLHHRARRRGAPRARLRPAELR